MSLINLQKETCSGEANRFDDRGARNASVELLRLLLMFGIVLLHVIGFGGWCRRGYWDVLRPCVDGFVFISGYYGIRFASSKILKLIGVGVWCAIVSVVLRGLIVNVSFEGLLPDVSYSLSKGYWFLWSYIVMTCFAPLVNLAVVRFDENKTVLCTLMILVFGYSYLDMMPLLRGRLPMPFGFGQSSFFTLLGVYIAARVFSELKIERYISKSVLAVGLIVSLTLCWFGVSHYHSPFAVSLAAFVFVLFKRIKISGSFRRFVLFCTPSLFSIYLLHQTIRGWNFIVPGMRWCVESVGLPIQLAWIIVASGVFLFGLSVDLLRRLVVYGIRRLGLWVLGTNKE